MLKIHALFEHGLDAHPHGCAYIRLLLPFGHPHNAKSLLFTSGLDYPGEANVVIVERNWQTTPITLAEVEALVQSIRQSGARLLYTLDDNLLDLPPALFAQPGLTREQKRIVRYLARVADGVLVSTEPLKQRMLTLNPRIEVVPNALDERLFAAPTPRPLPPRDKVVIGFMGTFSHDADFMLILQALRTVLHRYGARVELQLVGGVQDNAVVQALAGLPVTLLNHNRPYEYPAFVQWMVNHLQWDIALAPLEDTPFTRCKSDIKFLDYSALGFPGIYSDMPVYANTVRHLETGYLAPNTVAGWQTALETLIENAALRQTLAQNAHQYVWANRMLAQCAPRWVAAVQALL